MNPQSDYVFVNYLGELPYFNILERMRSSCKLLQGIANRNLERIANGRTVLGIYR